jgi:hypothetical protein
VSGRGILAVGGGGPVLVLWSGVSLGLFDGSLGFLGFNSGVAPPYFSNSS